MPFQQISIFRPNFSWLTAGIFLSIHMETACEHKSLELGENAVVPPEILQAAVQRQPVAHRHLLQGLDLPGYSVGGLSSPSGAPRPGRWLLPREMFYLRTEPDTCTHNCLFSWKEDVPAAEQCLCDHSCNLVWLQQNGQILWDDNAQQVFYWRECRYGNVRNTEGWRW